ncbi:hypothetical protein V5799_026670 [Amblyomma americanum]|uniref:Secreted protein n=1 Tax=Amblyomma americanum TaxID=6943 RepID=A0AAQ4DHX3_AMBAM
MLNFLAAVFAVFVVGPFLISSGENSSCNVTDIAWKFISGNGSNMYLLHRNFVTDSQKRDNIKCTVATKMCLNESTQSAIYGTTWYNVTANKT